MGRIKLEIIGQKFGRITPLSFVGLNRHRKAVFSARCDCGKDVKVSGSSLLRGNTKSCGCLKIDQQSKHGGASHRPGKTPLKTVYRAYCAMVRRCHSPTAINFSDYGGRGILVCDRWRSSFADFVTDMLPSYAAGLSLDRIDNDKGYSLENCRWATPVQQSQNTRVACWYDTETYGRLPRIELAKKIGLSRQALRNRMSQFQGRLPENILFLPRTEFKTEAAAYLFRKAETVRRGGYKPYIFSYDKKHL
jgi:hypothetical protein